LPVSTIDVFPTIVGRVGAEAPPSPYAGVDVRKLEGGRSTLAFWQTLAMVRRGHFKQIFVDGEPIALFNLERDPLAQRNIIAAKSALVDELAAVLAATGSLSSRIDSDSRKSIERLRQIGYIE
jgi:arylsulfatase A-like enzyme